MPPLSTGETPGYEAESIGFNNAEGAPVRFPIEQKTASSSGFIAAAIELKFAPASTDGVVEGYGSVFGNVDRHGDIVEPGAFLKSLAAHRSAGTMPAMLWQHDPTRPVGAWESASEDATGLHLRGRLNLETQDGREASSLLKQGAISGLSIGFQVRQGGARIDAKGIRRLSDLDLWEVSLVTFPSNQIARVTAAKAESARDLETLLRDIGFAKAAARKIAAGGWPALHVPDQTELATELSASVKAALADLKGLTQ